MTNFKYVFLSVLVLSGTMACKKDKDPVIIIPPSSGAEVTLNGLAGSEAGSSAGNAVYLDLSGDKNTPVLRSGWDLGFYSGSDFRVILNNTASAGVKVLDKTDLAAVSADDTTGLTLAVSQMAPDPAQLEYFDDIPGDLTKTAIPAVSATESANPVIILNRGTGGGIAARPWVKLRVLRNGDGYTLQYAGLDETTVKTLNVPKDADFNFTFVSIDNGIVQVEPAKDNWDIVWSYSVYETDFGGGLVPYNFSDLIAINYLAGVQAAEKVYADEATAADAYTKFNKDSLSRTTLVNDRWVIGSKWRSTQPATGAKKDRFYVIKDAAGNYYKFKCLAMGVGDDGGVRGKPEFKYELLQ
ncbi:MAG: hypothetical protein M9933_12015 [Chitinophagaceae bacterium]|nr:hypothetical protein [Chitinophagaceae bacterium]